MLQPIRSTEHVKIENGTIVKRESVRAEAPGHAGKGWFARHDRGRPQFNSDIYTCHRLESAATADEDVEYELRPRPVDDVRAWGSAAIDSAADDKILAARTQGQGIAAVYDAQRAEMMEYLARVASGQPTPGDLFPVMTALVGSSVGVDLAAVSETIRLRVTGEAQRLAAINRKRLDGKAAVAAASSVEAVAAAVAAARAQIEGA